MSEEAVFDLTRMMEGFVGEEMPAIDIMRELLKIAEEAHLNSGYTRFRIGDHVYTLDQLEEIQRLEEHEQLVARHLEAGHD